MIFRTDYRESLSFENAANTDIIKTNTAKIRAYNSIGFI